MLTFYFSPGSSSMAVHIALHETGAPLEARPISFATKDMRSRSSGDQSQRQGADPADRRRG
jgi:hypothetical protein